MAVDLSVIGALESLGILPVPGDTRQQTDHDQDADQGFDRVFPKENDWRLIVFGPLHFFIRLGFRLAFLLLPQTLDFIAEPIDFAGDRVPPPIALLFRYPFCRAFTSCSSAVFVEESVPHRPATVAGRLSRRSRSNKGSIYNFRSRARPSYPV